MDLILELSTKYPSLATVIMVVGTLRLLVKPLMSFLREFVQITPTHTDNAWLKRLEESKWWKAALYFLDWFGSIKLQKKPKLF